MSTLHLGLATAPHLAKGVPDDRLVLPLLRAVGIEPVYVSWTEPLSQHLLRC